MGLGDLVSKVLFEFKGDTGDLKTKIKDLQGVEKKRAESLLNDLDRTNKGYEKAIDILGKVGLALDTVGKFTDFARDAMKRYGEHTRLTTATAGINIDRLSKSFGGLVTQHDLLTFAAQTANGAFKLNQGEMETLGQAAIALKNRGFDLNEAIEKLTNSMIKGKAEGLDDFGLSVKDGASKAETLKNIMDELNRVIKESGSSSNDAADDVQRLAVEWDNASDALKRYTVEALKAIDVEAARKKFLDKAARSGAWAIGPDGMPILTETAMSAALKAYDKKVAELTQFQTNRNFATGFQKGRQNVRDRSHIDFEQGYTHQGGKGRNSATAQPEEVERNIIGTFNPWETNVELSSHPKDWERTNELVSASFETLNQSMLTVEERYANWMAGQPTLLEKLGLQDLEPFSLAIAAVDAFGSAWRTSLQAIGEGSMGAAEIFKQGLGAVVRGVGDQLAALGAAELVKGAAMAITLNPAAGLHLAAGGVYSAGAVAAYAAASKLTGDGSKGAVPTKPSTGGASTSAGGSSGGGASQGGGSSGGNSSDRSLRPINVIVGEHFGEMSVRERRQRAEEAVARALRERDE